jgi:hypothetical protein
MSKTRPLSHERGTGAEPKRGKRWQLCKICSTLIIAAFGLWFRVERPTRYMPIVSSQTWIGVNQCMYARGWGKLPRCDGSVKMTRISATRKPKYTILIVSEIRSNSLYITYHAIRLHDKDLCLQLQVRCQSERVMPASEGHCCVPGSHELFSGVYDR